MPSVDLALLRSQSIELAGQLDDPALFRASLRRMMESYAHRLLRRGRSMERRGALQAWDVPGLLIREVDAALRPAAQNHPDSALAAADAVWAEGKLEEKLARRVPGGLLAEWFGIASLLFRWLHGMEDPAVFQALSTRICLPLAAENPTLFRSQLRSWMDSPAPPLRRFGWMALSAWQEEESSESIFAALDLLPLIFPETDPEVDPVGRRHPRPAGADRSPGNPRMAGGSLVEGIAAGPPVLPRSAALASPGTGRHNPPPAPGVASCASAS